MQAKQENGLSITVPHLVDIHDSNKHESSSDVEKAKKIQPFTNLSFCQGTSSFFKTTFNGLNALSGVAILSTPYALSSGGWLSLILLFIIAIVTFYTGILIKKCMEVDPNIRSYPDIGHKAFGRQGRIIISTFIHAELYLIAVGFLILAGDNLHKLLPNMETNIFGIPIGGPRSFVVLTALIVMPTVLINKMTTLSYISATGVAASVLVLGAVLRSGLSDGIGFHQKGVLLNWSGLPTAISLYTVLSICFLLCTFIYASMAIMGYLMFGSAVESEVTLNLPTGSFSSKFAISTALINPIAKYALMLKPIVDAFETRLQSSYKSGKRFFSLSFRIALVVFSVIVAIALPFFGSMMSLIGAFFSATTSILFPCFCYLKISGAYKRLGFELVIIGFIVLMGLIILVFGTYTSLIQMQGY